MPQEINSKNEFTKVLSDNGLVVCKFTASWCAPCQAIKPTVSQLENKFPNIKFVEVDVDKQSAIAGAHGVASMPTFVYFENGSEVDRHSGATPQVLISKVSAFSTRGGVAGGSSSSSSRVPDAVGKYIAKGQELLNNIIIQSEVEVLNIQPKDSLEAFFGLNDELKSDTDSQILLHIPLQNQNRIFSVIIKSKKEGDDADNDEVQVVKSVKIWANAVNALSFDDANSGGGVLHEESELKYDENGLAELKLRFVKFQNVSSLDILIDGDDEDLSTILGGVAIVGYAGDQVNNKIEKMQDDE